MRRWLDGRSAPRGAPLVFGAALIALAVTLAVACAPDERGRVFGARCEATDECGCFDPAAEEADPECGVPGTTVMECVREQCSLPCSFGAAGDAFCRASFRSSSHCAFEGLCRE